jgi:diguanylate cyclase (GGDEF)-like protein
MEFGIQDISELFREDARTGVGNSLAFFEWLIVQADLKPSSPFSLVSVDVVGLAELNQEHGYAAGDAALRWVALILREEAGSEVFRIGPDEFIGVLTGGSVEEHQALLGNMSKRFAKEAEKVHLPTPPVRVSMIHYQGLEQIPREDVLGVVYGAFIEIKKQPDQSFAIFEPSDFNATQEVRWIINDLVRRMVSLGVILDKSHRMAYTDSLTGLPNMHAARHFLETTLQSVNPYEEPFCVLIIDGDDLARYNQESYLAGDRMIHQLGVVLKSNLKPFDFLARWRVGDEFFALLPDLPFEGALKVAERLREAVERESASWMYPITISIGVAACPDHGVKANELVELALEALSLGKSEGKNRVVLAPVEEQDPE